MNRFPHIPESAPFTPEQRAWLNGFLAGLLAPTGTETMAPPPAPSPAPATPAEPLAILFGSQTGTAEGLARRAAQEAAQRGFAPRILALNDHSQAGLTAGGKAIIITSTWGDGDPPDNAASFWSWLNTANTPRLDQLQYAILGLGDRNYPEFCGASKKFDARLESLGARRLLARGECDVEYETAAARWLEKLWTHLHPATPTNGKPVPVPLNGTVHASMAPAPRVPESSSQPVSAVAVFDRSRPFPGRLLRNVLLNQPGTRSALGYAGGQDGPRPGSAKEVRHLEISLEGSGLAYQAGDALGVVPVNCPDLVNALLQAVACAGDEPVAVPGGEQPARDAFARHYDITKPSPELLQLVAARVPSTDLPALLAPDRRDDLQQWLRGRDVLDVLALLPAPLPVDELIPRLRKLAPRLYSIASSPKAHPGEVHLTVSALRYESHGRNRKGVASTFLADRVGETDVVHVFVQPSPGFRPPSGGDTPMIMVGPGTGIAPFRAFLEERLATGARGRNWLFFGDQTRAADFLYESQLSAWVQSGHLTRLDLAFSRDQAAKVYVQHRMLEHAAELWAWLEDGAHFYVCGDASRMARDVDAALHRIVETAGGKTSKESKAYVETLKANRRYARDVY